MSSRRSFLKDRSSPCRIGWCSLGFPSGARGGCAAETSVPFGAGKPRTEAGTAVSSQRPRTSVTEYTWLIPLRGAELPSPNSSNMRNAAKRRRLIREVKDFAVMVGISERNRLNLAPATEYRHVTLTRLLGVGQREMDPDNCAAMLKHIRDSLQCPTASRPGSSWIVDDSPKWAIITYAQAKDHVRGPAIEVTVTDAVH